MNQIDLLTGQPVEAARAPDALSDRQQLAVEFIGQHQPVSSDELGAVLHEDRMRRGGKGHGRDKRCDWCSSEGAQMGDALRKRGLVIRKKTVGWCLAGYTPERDTTGYDPATAPLPEGF